MFGPPVSQKPPVPGKPGQQQAAKTFVPGGSQAPTTAAAAATIAAANAAKKAQQAQELAIKVLSLILSSFSCAPI